MKQFVAWMLLLAMLLAGCVKSEPATVATISPGPAYVMEEG